MLFKLIFLSSLLSFLMIFASGDSDVGEEDTNYYMSPHMKCDACLGIAHQLHESLFKKLHNLERSQLITLKELEILETVESACDKNFNDYGVKQVEGSNRISGPGIPHLETVGKTQIDQWPQRLQEMCHDYVGEVEETDIYKVFLKGKLHMIEFFCLGKGILGDCTDLKTKSQKAYLENKGGKSFQYKPKLSEEESGSYMSQHMKCDACLGISYQLITSLAREQKRLDGSKQKKTLTKNEILKTIENTCNKNFGNYGVNQVGGWNRISGPGIPHVELSGKTQIGKWPARLQAMCHVYVIEVGEMTIYELYLKSSVKLIEYLCTGKGFLGHCNNLEFPKTEL